MSVTIKVFKEIVNARRNSMIIILCGFMGAGKSYQLRKIQEKSQNYHQAHPQEAPVEFYDLDRVILESFATKYISIEELIRKRGLSSFRFHERKTLLKIIVHLQNKSEANSVISLGGGALTASTLKFLKDQKNIKTVWLDTSFEQCLWRISSSGASRPLAKKGEKFLKQLYLRRVQYYSQCDIRQRFLTDAQYSHEHRPDYFADLVLNLAMGHNDENDLAGGMCHDDSFKLKRHYFSSNGKSISGPGNLFDLSSDRNHS